MSTNTTSPSSSNERPTKLTWTVNFTQPRAQVQAVTLAIQVICFFLIMMTMFLVYQQLLRNKSRFWKASLAGVFLLSPINLFEVAFTLSQWSKQSLWPFPSYMTMIADILLRFGYGTITICRFWRLKLIAPLQPTRSTLIFRVASVFVIIVSIVSLYSSIALHVTELAYAQDGVVVSTSTIPTVIFFREQDRALQFVTFMFVHVLNLACDATFVMTIIKSMKLSRQKETFTTREIVMTIAPYIPPALFTILYMMTSVITIAKIQIPVIGTFVVTTSIALSRIAPVVETFFFYAFAINHTRMLLKNTSRGGSNSHSRGQITTSGGGRSGGQTTAAYSGYTSQVALSQIKPLDSFSPSEKASSRGYAAKGPLPPSTATFADQPYSLAATPAVGISHNPAPASYGQHQPQWSSGRTFADPDPTPAAPVRYTSRGAMESNGYGPSPSQIQPHYEVPLSDPSQSPPMASGGSLDRQWSVALAKANGRF